MTNYTNLSPMPNGIFVRNLAIGERKSKAGVILLDDNGKEHGIMPRWAEIWKIGDEAAKTLDLKVGQWILIEHGRWSRNMELTNETTGEVTIANFIDNDAIMIVSDTMPDEAKEILQ